MTIGSQSDAFGGPALDHLQVLHRRGPSSDAERTVTINRRGWQRQVMPVGPLQEQVYGNMCRDSGGGS